MRETILNVLEKWKDLQPNMASEAYREILTKDLCDAIQPHVNNIIEEIVTGSINNE